MHGSPVSGACTLHNLEFRSVTLLAYEKSGPLTAANGNRRIFAPVAYPMVRSVQIVPIVHVEAFALAPWFPICWQAREPRPVLVVVRTLNADGSSQPHGSPQTPASLPLALRAYPFVVGAPADLAAGNITLVDDAIPDEPSDAGAPILTTDGRPGRGAQMRLRAAATFNGALELTESMTAELQQRELFEPWPLQTEAAGKTIGIEGLLVVRPGEYDSPRIFRFVRKFGAVGAGFLGAHRISLYRAAALAQLARAGAKAAAAPESAPA
jgi:hypothetical protein